MKLNFKNVQFHDFSTYFNIDEFGEWATINGQQILVVFDRDKFRERKSTTVSIKGDGVQNYEESLFCRTEDLGYRPHKGSSITVNDDFYVVHDCIDNSGILEIVIGVHIG